MEITPYFFRFKTDGENSQLQSILWDPDDIEMYGDMDEDRDESNNPMVYFTLNLVVDIDDEDRVKNFINELGLTAQYFQKAKDFLLWLNSISNNIEIDNAGPEDGDHIVTITIPAEDLLPYIVEYLEYVEI